MSTQAASPLGPIRRRVPKLPQLSGPAVTRARLRVVPRRRTRTPRIPFVTLVSLVLVGGVVGLLLFNTSLQQASFAASSLEEQARTLTAREQTLRMELDDLRDPQRVAEQAQRMGMVPAVSPAFLNALRRLRRRRPDGGHPGERAAHHGAPAAQARGPHPGPDRARGSRRHGRREAGIRAWRP